MVAAGWGPLLWSGEQQGGQAPPYRNLVFILIDDLGAIDLACSGSTYYRTPHIDALAARGLRFTQAYAASGVCSPTRASILTGRYPQRCRMTSYVGVPSYPHARLKTPPNAKRLDDGERGYAQGAEAAGIRSCRAGKWHLGRRGAKEFGFAARWDNKQQNRKDDPWSVNELTGRVCQFIEDCGEERFLAVLSHHTVHVPLHERPERIARWREVEAGANGQQNPTMGAMVESMDRSVGQVMATLEKTGHLEDTAVVFFSDNGGLLGWKAPGVGRESVTSNLPLRNGKSTLYEGGIRVPLIIAAPGRTDGSGLCHTPVHSNDLAPTFRTLLGLPPMPAQHLDGVDLLPLLGGGTLAARNLFWYYPHYQALPPHAAVRSGDWKLLHFYEEGRNELYHLASDIGETQDLAAELPETTAALAGLLDQHLNHLKAPRPVGNPNHDAARAREAVRGQPGKGVAELHPPVTTPDPAGAIPLTALPGTAEREAWGKG